MVSSLQLFAQALFPTRQHLVFVSQGWSIKLRGRVPPLGAPLLFAQSLNQNHCSPIHSSFLLTPQVFDMI